MGNSTVYDDLIKSYDVTLDHSGVKGERLAKRLHELSEIGYTEPGGVRRPGLSSEEKQAKQLVKSWMEQAGLKVREDGAGNVFGSLAGKTAGPAIASGSHVDSVPNGGNFDGPLGVLSALEVVEAWKETGFVPEKPYEVVIFTDEEGSRFNSGLTGSRAMTGDITEAEMKQLRDYNGEGLEQVLTSYGSSLTAFQQSVRDLSELELFAEVHIEQGTKLEQENEPVGIVSGIAGPAWIQVEFSGHAGHAGNTPMIGRTDSLVAAGEFVSRLPELPQSVSDTAVATVGKLDVSPNGINVIPERVVLHVDARDIQTEPRDLLVERVQHLAEEVTEKHGVSLTLQQNTSITPVPIADELQQELADILEQQKIKPVRIPSGAGHDAMILGRRIPVAMLFVRSQDGISHNPKEWSSLSDCVQGVHVLKAFIESRMKKSAFE
ncbi:Zn-dependent hydrolase [Planococcus sp. ISL-109]|uniref:Zn-dependent hydrolase n=1 Tax=Planococcus sp. ISL-109 TaxID=2819166 RepID=UPI001BED2B67|nr:Zn-dependent hydrolase [Planococcus sp. ISL-109]MBT2581667.1 Zn-dependent hydrolase [Planococcus sp. ISL-109]